MPGYMMSQAKRQQLSWNEIIQKQVCKIIKGTPKAKLGPTKIKVTEIYATVFNRLNTGIVGSNSIHGMDVCLRLFCVCVVGSGLMTD
jgi:hypothetical protein